MSFIPNREELAWAAGFFDGEGHVGAVRPAKKFQRIDFAQIAITQIDRYVLDRFRDAVGVGKVYGPYRQQGRSQPQYRYIVQHYPKTQAVCAMLWPWLGPVKRAQFSRALLIARKGMVVQERCAHHLPPFACPDCLRAYNTKKMRGWRALKKLAHVALAAT